MWFTRVSIKNPYFATVLMFMLLLLGSIAANRVSVEEFPDVKLPVVVVSTLYPGASPTITETDVTKPIEEAINSLNGIDELRSYSFSGRSVVVAQFVLSTNPDLAIQDVRDKVAAVAAGFRKEIETPLISKTDITDNPIMSVAIVSTKGDNNDTILRNLTDWATQVAVKKLQTVVGVGQVDIVGGINRQIRINIEPYKLQSLGLSINNVVTAIQNANSDYPAGYIVTKDKNINVQLNGRIINPADFANIVITYRNNTPIRVADVANVVDGQADYQSLSLRDGKRVVGLDIRPAVKANIISVATGVYKVIKELDKIKPANTKIVVTYDTTQSVKDSLNDVEKTLFEGTLLTIFIVFIFLKSWRSTIITGLTLPIALFGTMFAIYAFGFTLNMMTLMALSLSIGLLIDDAIVVRENIVRHLHMGKDHHDAALEGTEEIGLAVLSTTLAVVAVFLPVGFMAGIIGKFFYEFGITVTVAVLISLFVSFTLDPMLSSVWHEPKDGGWLARSPIGKALDYFEYGFDRFTIFYEKVIRLSLNYKKITLLIAGLVLVGSFMLVPLIGGEFIPQVDKGKFSLNFKTQAGSNVDYTEQKIKQVSAILNKNYPEIKSIYSGVNSGFAGGTNSASLTIDVGDKNSRHRSIFEIMRGTRSLVSKVAGITIQNIMVLGGAGGNQKPIDINIQGADTQVLAKIAKDLMTKLRKVKGVTDLQSSFDDADPAFLIGLNRDMASNLGVNLDQVGSVLSTLFAGNKASTWEDPHTGENYDVVVQIPDSKRGEHALSDLTITANQTDSNGKGLILPISTITQGKVGSLPRKLEHYNLQRNVAITGNITGVDNNTVFKEMQPILDKYPFPTGYSIVQSGSKKDMMESLGYAVAALLTGIAFIYMVLTSQFRSFILPLVIMVSLPLSFVGVFVALLLFHSTLNMFSVIGIIMLMGLATKNGILLVDFINQELDRGLDKIEAIVSAGKTRLRPIIMTTAAMIFGMLPLALSTGESTETRKPMAYAIIGGMTTSTILTLIIVPVVFVYLQQFRKFVIAKLQAK